MQEDRNNDVANQDYPSASSYITPVFNSILGILGSVSEAPSDDEPLFKKKKKRRRVN